ncbi:MAG: ABC transporter permease [Kiritimatiellae bacterium]|nr:ABC transporter permease [Kiritimatiellia bacterium]
MLERVKPMLIKEFIQIARDPKMLRVIFIVPILQMMIFGYAVTTDVRHVATAVYDLDNTVASRELVQRFARSGYFDIVEYIVSDRRLTELIDHSDVCAVLRFNKGFETDLQAGRSAHVQLILDGTDSNTARIILNYGMQIAGQFSRQILVERLMHRGGQARPTGEVSLQMRAWFNANLESRNYFVPGVIAILVMLITLMLTGMAVVREKEIGTMEQVMVTPITPAEFILGKTLPFALIGFADVLLVTAVGVFWFDVPIRGHLFLLLVATALYLMTSLGIGLLISTVSQTQQQAMMSTFFFFFPAVLLSGFMFPIANMPPVVQWATYLNPLRYFLVIVRGIFLKGVGVGVLWPQMAALAVLGVCVLWLATRRFRKTMA